MEGNDLCEANARKIIIQYQFFLPSFFTIQMYNEHLSSVVSLLACACTGTAPSLRPPSYSTHQLAPTLSAAVRVKEKGSLGFSMAVLAV